MAYDAVSSGRIKVHIDIIDTDSYLFIYCNWVSTQ